MSPCEDHAPYFMFRDVTFAYNNEAMQVRVEPDEFQENVFILMLCERVVGYFAPAA